MGHLGMGTWDTWNRDTGHLPPHSFAQVSNTPVPGQRIPLVQAGESHPGFPSGLDALEDTPALLPRLIPAALPVPCSSLFSLELIPGCLLPVFHPKQTSPLCLPCTNICRFQSSDPWEGLCKNPCGPSTSQAGSGMCCQAGPCSGNP